MKVWPLKIACSISLILLNFSSFAFTEDEDKLQFSGFARVVMGYLDDKNAEYLNYDNSVSIDKESLIGLQVDYQIIDSLALTGQVIGHAGNQRDSGIEWLGEIPEHWTIRKGSVIGKYSKGKGIKKDEVSY